MPTRIKPLQISSPGRNPYGKWGVDDVRDNGDTLTTPLGISAFQSDGTTPLAGVSFADVRKNLTEVTIAEEVYPAGTAVLFTLLAVADLDPADGIAKLTYVSTGGLELVNEKPIELGPIPAR